MLKGREGELQKQTDDQTQNKADEAEGHQFSDIADPFNFVSDNGFFYILYNRFLNDPVHILNDRFFDDLFHCLNHGFFDDFFYGLCKRCGA